MAITVPEIDIACIVRLFNCSLSIATCKPRNLMSAVRQRVLGVAQGRCRHEMPGLFASCPPPLMQGRKFPCKRIVTGERDFRACQTLGGGGYVVSMMLFFWAFARCRSLHVVYLRCNKWSACLRTSRACALLPSVRTCLSPSCALLPACPPLMPLTCRLAGLPDAARLACSACWFRLVPAAPARAPPIHYEYSYEYYSQCYSIRYSTVDRTMSIPTYSYGTGITGTAVPVR